MQSLQDPQSLQSLQKSKAIPLNAKEFLSIKDAANLIGASRWTIQRLISSNKIKVTKIGRRTIISRSEIDKLFN
ncbi:helix-turn-helix domain-containing protein [Mangrovibacterium sp.]|uniref:helix-turn-helix domain-containing protein n=1 Tax=Mangrovibacterium sp. TaxID=1961364 RepID=UPI003567DDFE